MKCPVWYCSCLSENDVAALNCENCGKEKHDFYFPLWQRAMHDPASDCRKYKEPESKRAGTKPKPRPDDWEKDWW